MSIIRDVQQKVRSWFGRGEEETDMEERRQAESRVVRQRYRRMAERLTENSSLRDELDDEKAKELLDWGNGYLKKMADKTAELPDETAENILETEADRVSGVMRQVNQLVRAINIKDPQQLVENYQSLTRQLKELREKSEDTPETVEELISLSGESKDWLAKQLVSPTDGEIEQIDGKEEE